ncbi:MAG: EFR1 family ferrodoxin [Methanosphaera sp.]|nr:EFR1 family ferrodoxin [Methanosphaera sp.]
MIIYFSATGNNQHIANTIAQQLNDKKESIIQLDKKEQYTIPLEDNEKLGIIIPTYFLGLPSYVEEYLSKTRIIPAKNNYIYIISTYGTSPGYSTGYIKEYLEEQNIPTHAQYTIKMPDTWTPFFDVSNKQKNNTINDNAQRQTEQIITMIKERKQGKYTKNTLPKIIANIAQLMYDRQRKTSNLKVDNTCNKCGTCAENCPINAITVNDDKIEWVTERCVMCLRCLHKCPQFAIQYKNMTRKHGQYINPHIKTLD